MATSTLPKAALWMQNVNYPASLDRTLIDVLYATEGVISGFAVTPVSGLTISVSAGQAVITGDEVANQGKYLVDSDAAVQLTLGSVGSNRTEYVWLQINDPAVSGGRAGNNVTIVTGTSVPANSVLLLATLTLTAGTSTITAGMIADNRVYTDVVADGSIETAELADGAVTLSKMAANSVDSDQYVDGSIDTVHIGNAQVTLSKMAANSVDSDQYVDGSIDTEHLSNGAVTASKMETASGTLGSVRWYRQGKMVTVWTTSHVIGSIGTLPSGSRPVAQVRSVAIGPGPVSPDYTNVVGEVTITTGGAISVAAWGASFSGGFFSVSFQAA